VNALPEHDALISFLHSESERERSELSRRLHDDLGGLLTTVKFDAAAVKRLLPPGSGEAVNDSLTRLFNSIRSAVDLQRDLVEQLRPGILDHLGLFAAIRWQLETFCAQAGLSGELQIDIDDRQITAGTSIVLFRALQDALQSVGERATARTVRLLVQQPELQLLVIEIEDNGPFMATALSGDPRLRSMQHRVASLGGYCEFSGDASRTLVRFCVPLPGAAGR